MRSYSLTGVVVVVVSLLFGCAPDPSPTSLASRTVGQPQAGAKSDALASVIGFVPWGDQIKLCFTNIPNPDGGTTNFLLAETAARIALDETWGAASAVDFTYIGTCPTPLAENTLKIELRGGTTGYGVCGYGKGASCTFGADSPVNGVLGLKGLAVHEVGHALGFGHEHQRQWANAGWEGILCEFEATRLSQANQVIAAGMALCFNPDGCPDGSGLVTPETAIEWRDNRVPTPYNKLTPYDDLSIMNYCASAYGRTDHMLTTYDRLGIEMLYPGDFAARRIVADSGPAFRLASRIVTRTDAPVVLSTDWTSRGALDEFFTGVVWRLDGAQVASGVRGSYPALLSGVRSASVSFSDVPTSRAHSGSILLEANNALHTAILMSSLQL